MAKANVEVPLTESEIVEEATGVKLEAEEVATIKYSNVAQLQSINMLGSKDGNNGVAGYDYWSVGATANFDKILSDKALVGASIGVLTTRYQATQATLHTTLHTA
ncbi:MAG: hypothetical protein R3Y46_04975 [Opitutales bacterium]